MASGKDIVCHGADPQQLPAVTTSWDDGHPLDLRVAELLNSHGLRGTFYVPNRSDGGSVMDADHIRTLHRMGMEIGSHSMNHIVLTKLAPDRVLHELSENKEWLEDLLGEPVTSFCYPKGKFNRMVRSRVINAGYRLARTTMSFRLEEKFDPYRMPVSFQFYPHTRSVHIRHALKEGNLKGIINWVTLGKMEGDILCLTERLAGQIMKRGGILHIWGHSWEIEKYNLWELLEKVCRYLANCKELFFLTNLQVLDTVKQ